MERKLDVAISTWQPEGITRVGAMDLPRVDGVHYVVSWQNYGDDPRVPSVLADRGDVTVCLCERAGVSANRNNAVANCRAPLVLIGDDDLCYYPEALTRIIHIFDSRPSMMLATFRYEGSSKKYPDSETCLGRRLPRHYSASCPEIAIRREVWSDVRFDENFGPGAPYLLAAEDEKFLLDARRAGLECHFVPLTICRHEHPSTGSRRATPGVARAQGKYIRLEYRYTWPLRLPLKAWRERKKGQKFPSVLKWLAQGAFFRPGKDGNADK